jgi:glycosyltransferase involved in cell wall biosynthesis
MSAAFSAVIVARNEEALIARCLESVTWCDERIVVDMESADRGIELCTGDWILVVDADEVITDKLAARLSAEVEADSETCGIWLPRLVAALAGHGARRLWSRWRAA